MNIGAREFLFIMVLAAVPISAWYFVFQPRNNDIAEARAEIDAMQGTLIQLSELNQKVGDLGVAVNESEIRLTRFRENIPDADDVDEMLSELDQIGVRNKLNVKSIRTMKQVDVGGYSELPLSLNIQGDFAGIYRFIADVESLPRITRVSELELKRDLVKHGRNTDESQKAGMIEMKLTLVIYFEDEFMNEADAEGAEG